MNKLRLSIIAIILFSSTAYARNNNSNINEKIESIIKNGLEMSKKMNQLDNHENKN